MARLRRKLLVCALALASSVQAQTTGRMTGSHGPDRRQSCRCRDRPQQHSDTGPESVALGTGFTICVPAPKNDKYLPVH